MLPNDKSVIMWLSAVHSFLQIVLSYSYLILWHTYCAPYIGFTCLRLHLAFKFNNYFKAIISAVDNNVLGSTLQLPQSTVAKF